jgi:hypothetical protein
MELMRWLCVVLSSSLPQRPSPFLLPLAMGSLFSTPSPSSSRTCFLTATAADVELQLIFQLLDVRSKLRWARCCRRMLVVACDPFAWKEGAEPMRIAFDQLSMQHMYVSLVPMEASTAAMVATVEAVLAGTSAPRAADPDVIAMAAGLRSVQPWMLCARLVLDGDWQAKLESSAASLKLDFFGLDASSGMQTATLHAFLNLRCMRHLRWLRLKLRGRGYGPGCMALTADDIALIAAQCAASLTSLTLSISAAACQLPFLHDGDDDEDVSQLQRCLASLAPLQQEGALPQLTELTCPASLWNCALSEAPFAKQLHRLCLSGGHDDKGNVWLDARTLGELRQLRLEQWHLDSSLEANEEERGQWSVPLRDAFASMVQLRSLEFKSLRGGVSELLQALTPTSGAASAVSATAADPAPSLRSLTLDLSLRIHISVPVMPWSLVEEMVALLNRRPSLYVNVLSHRPLAVQFEGEEEGALSTSVPAGGAVSADACCLGTSEARPLQTTVGEVAGRDSDSSLENRKRNSGALRRVGASGLFAFMKHDSVFMHLFLLCVFVCNLRSRLVPWSPSSFFSRVSIPWVRVPANLRPLLLPPLAPPASSPPLPPMWNCS